jgi:hypothetical protein
MAPKDKESLASNTQQALVDLLNADLEIAFAAIRSARAPSAPSKGRQGQRGAIEQSRTVLENVRRLNGRVQDPVAWESIHARANELEAALREARKPSE